MDDGGELRGCNGGQPDPFNWGKEAISSWGGVAIEERPLRQKRISGHQIKPRPHRGRGRDIKEGRTNLHSRGGRDRNIPKWGFPRRFRWEEEGKDSPAPKQPMALPRKSRSEEEGVPRGEKEKKSTGTESSTSNGQWVVWQIATGWGGGDEYAECLVSNSQKCSCRAPKAGSDISTDRDQNNP